MTTKDVDTCKEKDCTCSPKYSARPKARVYETDNDFTLELEMPGISETDAEITLHKRDLTVVGESDDLEIRYDRRFKLPETVNTGKVSASMQFGILTLVLPKSEEVKPKTIKVLAG